MHSRGILQLPLRAASTSAPVLIRFSVRNASTAVHGNVSTQSSRWTRRLIYAGIFGSLGLGAGKWMDSKFAAPPLQGSAEDQAELQLIQRAYEIGLPIVQQLRRDPDYTEKDVYGSFSDDHKTHRLTSGPLSGSRGLGLQKVFLNEKENKLVSVVYFGPGLEGWPTMVHGGALGTVIDENLGRAAIRNFPARTGVTANLNINYRAPVYSGNFYSLHTTLDQEQSTDQKAFATCQVRDMSGRLCVEASGLFVVPKKLKLKEIGEHF